MPDRDRGLFGKYHVRRSDGADQEGGRHEGCELFVLDVTHDAHARRALVAYIASVEEDGYEALAKDLRTMLKRSAYANSVGWATTLTPELRVGSVFRWAGKSWDVASYFAFPCCARVRVALVRLVGSGLDTWSGLECPECGQAYTVEPETLRKRLDG